jgi:hypothetical protein
MHLIDVDVFPFTPVENPVDTVRTATSAPRLEPDEGAQELSEVFHDASGVFNQAGTAARVPGPDPERRSDASFASFQDPDGNTWFLQEITDRLPGR